MLSGEWVLKGGGTQKTFAFGRGGMAALFSVEVMGISGSPTLTITVEHKNLEDNSWSTAATFSSITTTGVTTLNATPLKEMVRYSYSISATNGWEGLYLLMAPPAWRPY